MDSEVTRWTVLVIVNVPLFLGLGRLFFDDWGGFFACVGFWFTPDWISLLRDELWDDWWGTTKLFVFIALCTGAVYGEHQFFFGAKTRRTSVPPAQSLVQDTASIG